MLINEIKNRIKKEGSLSIYIKDYFGVPDPVLYEIVLSYIDYLLKIDPKFEEDIKKFLKEETSSFFLDRLLNLKLLPNSFLDRNYFGKLGMKKGVIDHKGYIDINERYLTFNFISEFFQSVDGLDKIKDKFIVKIVQQYENEFLNEDKIKQIKQTVEFNFLKNAGLLDEPDNVKKEILQREKNKLRKNYLDFILSQYQLDIKENILDKLGYNEYESKVINEEKMLVFLKNFFKDKFDFNKLQNIYLDIQNLQLRKLFVFYISALLYIYLLSYIVDLMKKDLDPKKKEDKEKIKQLEKYKVDNKLFKEFNNIIDYLVNKEYLLQEVFFTNFYNGYLGDILDYKTEEFRTDSFKFKGIVGMYNKENIQKLVWYLQNNKQDILKYLNEASKKYVISNYEIFRKINSFVNSNEYKKLIEEKKKAILDEVKHITKKILDFHSKIEEKIKLFNEVEYENLEFVPDLLKFNLKMVNNYLSSKLVLENLYKNRLQKNILKDLIIEKNKYVNYKDLFILMSDENFLKAVEDILIEVGVDIDYDKIISDDKYYKEIQKQLNSKDVKSVLVQKLGKDYKKFVDTIIVIKKYEDIYKLAFELSQEERKQIKLNGIQKKLIKLLEDYKKEFSLFLELGKINFLNIGYYENKAEYMFNLMFSFFKIDKFVYAFFIKKAKGTYIDNFFIFLIKLIFYSLSKDIYKIKLLNNKKIRELFTASLTEYLKDKEASVILSENLFYLYNNFAEFLYKFFLLQNEYRRGTIKYEEYKIKLSDLENQLKVFGKLEEYIRASIKYVLRYFETKEKREAKGNVYIEFLNQIIDQFEKYNENWKNITGLLNYVLSFVEEKEEKISGYINTVSDLLAQIDVLEKIDIFKLLYILITEDVTIEKSSDFFIIGYEEYAFVVMNKYDMSIMNAAILTLENDFKNKIHVFVYVNSAVFFYLFGQLRTKLELTGISVLSRDLLSWLYYNNEVSDLDMYGIQSENMCRIKVRVNGTYKLLKRYEGSSEKEIFSFNDFEQFINDLFTLGGTIGDQRVEDTRIEIGGVIFRISIMKDGNNMSLSARKTSSVKHKFSILKGDQLTNILRENFNFEPIVKSLYFEKDTVTLDMSYTPEDVSILLDRATSDRGIFLIIGKTRSGKSTSLRNFLDYLFETGIRKGEVKKIITLEDPIEFRNVNWNQIEVPGEAGALEEAINKGLKRQDPDVVVVGEIRGASTLPGVLTVANNSATFSTMHITNPVDGLFTLKDFAKSNGNTLMDVVNVLNVIISQKLVNKIDKKKVDQIIQKVGIDYGKLRHEGIILFKNKVEIQDWLEKLGILWLVPVTRMDYSLLMSKYKKGELEDEIKEYVEGYLYFCKKTFDLYNEQGYLIKEIHKKYTKPKLYYDYIDRSFIDSNMELILRMDDKNSPIKEIKQRFVSTFALKEEKALYDYFAGELPYYDGLNILDVAYYIYILRKLYLINKQMDNE